MEQQSVAKKMQSRNKRSEKVKENLWCWLFMTPILITYCMFTAWPIISSGYYSMLDWSGMSSTSTFVGLQNFKEVMVDPLFWNAFLNSFKYMIKTVPLGLILSLILAVVLNNPKLKGSSIYRTLFFVPVITTASIMGIIMIFIWGANGPINTFLMNVNIIKLPINWLGDSRFVMNTVVIIGVWKGLGIDMIYWLAGLQGIPRDLYEAATVDGANTFQSFIYITLPNIVPIGAVIALLDIVGSLKIFDIIKTMTEGGPFFSTDVVATYIYRYAFSSEMGAPRVGYACAAGVFFGIAIIIIASASAWANNKIKSRSAL